MKFLLALIPAGLALLYGCGFNSSTKPINNTTSSFQSIDTFKIPDDIEGCGYYFSSHEQAFKRNDYLFVANEDRTGYISVDKKIIKLKLTSSTSQPEIFGDHIDVYHSDNYKVTVEINYKTKAEFEESWMADGTITIEDKTGKKAVRKFFGERGC